MSELVTTQETHAQIDELESAMMENGNFIDCPLDHVFTPGLYTRTILMPAGTLITSMIHREEHQYIVSMGVAVVKVAEDEGLIIAAPYKGITKGGTRRVLYIEEQCIWTTIHATDIYPASDSKEDFDAAVRLVEDQIFIKRENPILGGMLKNNNLVKLINQ